MLEMLEMGPKKVLIWGIFDFIKQAWIKQRNIKISCFAQVSKLIPTHFSYCKNKRVYNLTITNVLFYKNNLCNILLMLYVALQYDIQ